MDRIGAELHECLATDYRQIVPPGYSKCEIVEISEDQFREAIEVVVDITQGVYEMLNYRRTFQPGNMFCG